MSAEVMESDLLDWEIGPYHASLPGPIKIRLKLDGEVIARASVETGFAHRGLEKAIELQNWQSAGVYADRLDPENAVFAELALCMAAEDILGIQAPPRAQAIRVLICELARISSHFGFAARMARAVRSETMFHYVLRDRERVLDLIELLTGARFTCNFIRIGGVDADVTEGLLERVVESSDLVKVRLKEYDDLFTRNHAFLKRTSGIAILTRDQAQAWGITGPNLRSTGAVWDTRHSHPYAGYSKVRFQSSSSNEARVSDCQSRFLTRMQEIYETSDFLKALVDGFPEGPYLEIPPIPRDFKVPRGEAYSRVESSRGLLGCHVVANGSEKPDRVQFRVPSQSAIQVVPELVRGYRVEDLPVILASLDLSIAEVDR